ncbi:chorismate mutase family protein [Streptomyces sp. CA-132043]|uniref:chorismate mutase family protein n=1 Tax=Streptomyces sp. CA-132043 TaxID=3240048 RepID=UPI003D8BADF0
MSEVDFSTVSRLEDLRSILEEIDNSLLRVVERRIACCVRIGEYKKEHDVPMMQNHRIEAAHRRAQDFAVATGLDPDFLHRLYDLLIEETCRVEDLVIGGGRGQ